MQTVASENTVEELTREDLGDLRECIEQRLVFGDQSRPESLDWADFRDKEILQAWAHILEPDL
jgi:hypothetical protein